MEIQTNYGREEFSKAVWSSENYFMMSKILEIIFNFHQFHL